MCRSYFNDGFNVKGITTDVVYFVLNYSRVFLEKLEYINFLGLLIISSNQKGILKELNKV